MTTSDMTGPADHRSDAAAGPTVKRPADTGWSAGVGGKIFLTAMPLVAITVIAVQILAALAAYREDRADLRRRAEILTTYQADAIAIAVWNLDRRHMTAIITSPVADPDFLGARLRAPDGEILAESGDAGATEAPGAADVEIATRPVMAPASTNRTERIGQLSVALSSKSTSDRLTNQFWLALATTALMLGAFALALTISVSRFVGAPLARLLRAIDAVERGDLDVSVPVSARDEVGRVARAFDRMVGALRAAASARAELAEAQALANRALAEEARAEAANRAKSEFLANMSHEIRTPLNAIGNYAQLLREDLAGRQLDDLVADVVSIETANRHLLTIVNDILDLSKIEAGRMELLVEDFDLSGLLEEVRAIAEPLAARNGNRLSLDCRDLEAVGSDPAPFRMTSDITKLRQCLINLLSNAAKFTRDGVIDLVVVAQAEFITFSVRDTGIGMTEEHLSRVFKPFTQADASTTKRYGGTGLGLALTAQFVTMLRGSISVDSVPGQGSTFTIRLPRRVEGAVCDDQAFWTAMSPA